MHRHAKIEKKTVSRHASLKKIQESRKIGHNSIKVILKKYFPLQSLYLFGYYAVLFMVVSYNNLLLLFDRSPSSWPSLLESELRWKWRKIVRSTSKNEAVLIRKACWCCHLGDFTRRERRDDRVNKVCWRHQSTFLTTTKKRKKIQVVDIQINRKSVKIAKNRPSVPLFSRNAFSEAVFCQFSKQFDRGLVSPDTVKRGRRKHGRGSSSSRTSKLSWQLKSSCSHLRKAVFHWRHSAVPLTSDAPKPWPPVRYWIYWCGTWRAVSAESRSSALW